MTSESIDRRVLWSMVKTRLERELGEPCGSPQLLSRPWSSRATWAVAAHRAGELVVKARHGDRACEKTRWCALNLPLPRSAATRFASRLDGLRCYALFEGGCRGRWRTHPTR